MTTVRNLFEMLLVLNALVLTPMTARAFLRWQRAATKFENAMLRSGRGAQIIPLFPATSGRRPSA